VQPVAMSRNLASQVGAIRSQPATSSQTRRFVSLSHLRRLRNCDQVAAVCYRVCSGDIEFLLVQTRGSGRWTFPKGSVEPGLTHAQAAALEAFEEAGVHGRIEEVAFARYFRRKRGFNAAASSSGKRLVVNAHLCEVLRLGNPKEANRNRTWFSVEHARHRLREGHESQEAAEFARVVDRAVTRILQLRSASAMPDTRSHGRQLRSDAAQIDPLQRVRFEAFHDAGIAPYVARLMPRPRVAAPQPIVTSPGRKFLECEILPFNTRGKKTKALGTGTKG
jgi:8-oxo-dGTP pyrophosphatase MutT (NUDIX family)